MALMIKTQNLTKDYGGGRGVQNLSLEVPEKTIFGFIGPNGSGKSTTIKILCGLVTPSAGEAWVNGVAVNPRNHVEIKKIVGYLPDEFGVYEQMSVWEYLDFFGAAYKIPPKARKKRIDEVLEVTDASHMLDYQVSSLSRGMHQKIGIAKTMLHDPQLLILDEPANGLDPHARIEMRKTILRLKDMGKTIMLSSHILPELGAICDLVAILETGKLLTFGTVQDITRSLKQDMVIEIIVDSDLQAAMDICRDFDGVHDVSGSGQELRLHFNGARNLVADLNRLLMEKGTRVVSLKESEVDLENVFLTVTGRKDGKPVNISTVKKASSKADA